MKLQKLQEENEALKSRIQELEGQIERHYETQRNEEKNMIFLSASVIAQGYIARYGIPDVLNNAVSLAEEIYEHVYGRKAK